MIAPGTVLVLGAGASAPYGYPLGRPLVSEILERLEAETTSGGPLLRDLQDRGIEGSDIKEFCTALRTWDGDSIDEFLEHHGPDFVLIGKRAIADRILAADNVELLPEKAGKETRWYPLLFRHLAQPSSGDLKIVTFNYDHSLDDYLDDALSVMFPAPEAAAAEEIRARFDIIHVHGDAIGSSAAIAAQTILTMQEVTERTNRFSLAESALQKAKRVAFIGFGYHRANLDHLGINTEIWRPRSPDLVCGTQYRLLPNEVRLAEKQLEGAWGDMGSFHDLHALDFLRTVELFDPEPDPLTVW